MSMAPPQTDALNDQHSSMTANRWRASIIRLIWHLPLLLHVGTRCGSLRQPTRRSYGRMLISPLNGSHLLRSSGGQVESRHSTLTALLPRPWHTLSHVGRIEIVAMTSGGDQHQRPMTSRVCQAIEIRVAFLSAGAVVRLWLCDSSVSLVSCPVSVWPIGSSP